MIFSALVTPPDYFCTHLESNFKYQSNLCQFKIANEDIQMVDGFYVLGSIINSKGTRGHKIYHKLAVGRVGHEDPEKGIQMPCF